MRAFFDPAFGGSSASGAASSCRLSGPAMSAGRLQGDAEWTGEAGGVAGGPVGIAVEAGSTIRAGGGGSGRTRLLDGAEETGRVKHPRLEPTPWLPDATPRLAAPFTGEVEARTWNAQALFAQRQVWHLGKKAQCLRLMKQAHVLAIQETHGTRGKHRAPSLLAGMRPFWSHLSSQVGRSAFGWIPASWRSSTQLLTRMCCMLCQAVR